MGVIKVTKLLTIMLSHNIQNNVVQTHENHTQRQRNFSVVGDKIQTPFTGKQNISKLISPHGASFDDIFSVSQSNPGVTIDISNPGAQVCIEEQFDPKLYYSVVSQYPTSQIQEILNNYLDNATNPGYYKLHDAIENILLLLDGKVKIILPEGFQNISTNDMLQRGIDVQNSNNAIITQQCMFDMRCEEEPNTYNSNNEYYPIKQSVVDARQHHPNVLNPQAQIGNLENTPTIYGNLVAYNDIEALKIPKDMDANKQIQAKVQQIQFMNNIFKPMMVYNRDDITPMNHNSDAIGDNNNLGDKHLDGF